MDALAGAMMGRGESNRWDRHKMITTYYQYASEDVSIVVACLRRAGWRLGLFGWILSILALNVPLRAQSRPSNGAAERDASDGKGAGGSSLADLLLSDAERKMAQQRATARPTSVARSLPEVGDEEMQALGIRRLASKHLILYTDLPSDPFVDEIPQIFDLAVVQWAEYFEIPQSQVEDWKIAGSLIRDRAKFKRSSLWAEDLPPFLHGFQRGRQFWAYEQESAYYRRHLVLHEGVHGFMFDNLGGAGPTWYREGVAEYLATHQWNAGKLRIAYMPRTREEVPYWGRIRVLRREYAAGRPLMLGQIMRFTDQAPLKVDTYAWSWAVVAFLDGNLRYQKEFRKLKKHVRNDSAFFTREFETALRPESRELDEEWQLFIANIDYGYDFRRNAVRYQNGVELPSGGRSITISTDWGWQSSGIRMEKGKKYLIRAKGRFRVQQHPENWWSEPGGITIEYANGLPLGVLLGNIRRDEPLPGAASLVHPIRIGLGRRVTAGGDGTLYFRINESAGGLSDNTGQITVTVTEDTGSGSDTADSKERGLSASPLK